MDRTRPKYSPLQYPQVLRVQQAQAERTGLMVLRVQQDLPELLLDLVLQLPQQDQ